MNSSNPQKLKTWAWHILALIFFAYMFSITTNFVLNDPDLWWHLKTGEYIAKTKTIPNEDIFCFTTPKPLNEGQIQGLRANWLGQVILYSSYKIGGLGGVGFLRGFLVILPFFAMYLWLIERRLPPLLALISVSVGSLMLSVELTYAFERPQGMSFLLSLLAIMLLEELKARRAKAIALLPVLMAIWSNIHGGFAVGNVIIGLYIFGETITYLFKKYVRRSPEPLNKIFFAGSVLGIAASGLNPNGFSLIYGYLRGLASMFFKDVAAAVTRQGDVGWVSNVILEYKPLMFFYKELHYIWLGYYWALLAVLLAVVLFKYAVKKKFDFTEFLTLCFVNFFANYYARGLMFSLVISSFYLGKSILEIWEAREEALPKLKTYGVYASCIILVALLFSFIKLEVKTKKFALKPGIAKHFSNPWFPSRALAFIKEEKIAAPMYNFYTWGGFLIFAGYPDYQVFIDGRVLDNKVALDADSVLRAYPNWRKLLDDYKINFILVPTVYKESGHIIPLVQSIIYDDNWKMIFLADNSAVYVRNTPQNKDLISRFQTDKKNVYYEIIKIENYLIRGNPYNPIFRKSKANALFALGFVDDAREEYEKIPYQYRTP